MPSWKRRNPLVTKHDPPPELPAPPTEVELALEQARKDRRTVGKILSRDGTFVIDPDLELMTVGAATDPVTGVGIFLGLDTPDYEFRVGDPAGDQMLWDGSALTITGSITATTGTIGGWTIGATTLSSGNVTLDSAQESLRMGAATDANTGVGLYLGKDGPQYEFRIGDPGGHYLWWLGTSLSINGGNWTNPVSGSVLEISGWTHDIVFTIDDYNTVSWSGGSLRFPIGLQPSINAGTTGNLASTGYIYYDKDLAANDLQLTTSSVTATGHNKCVVAVAKPNADTTKLAELVVFGGGASPYSSTLVTADHIVANTITANEIAANTITASEIAAGTITATEITVSNLSSLNADLGTVTAGEITAGSISINATTERILMGSATGPITGDPGVFLGKDGTDYEFRIGHYANGNYVWWNGSTLRVSGAVISAPADGSDVGLLGWNQNMTWSVTDYRTVAWGAGQMYMTDGHVYNISAGNTGSMVNPTFVYLDTNVSVTVLQTTTTASNATGAGKVLVAVAAPNADTAKDAEFQVFGSVDTVAGSKIVTADVIAANTITANEIAANTITASEIQAGTITATEITVSNLSSLNADMGSLTAGSIVIGTTNKIWLNDAADGALNIGGSTKASAPFRVTAAGALTATSATITGTITSTSTIAAGTFTATSAIFEGLVEVEDGTGQTQLQLLATTSPNWGGAIRWYEGASPWAQMGVITVNSSDNFVIQAVNSVLITAGSGGTGDIDLTTDSDINLIPSTAGNVDFSYAEDTNSRTASGNYLQIKVNGNTRYLALYT